MDEKERMKIGACIASVCACAGTSLQKDLSRIKIPSAHFKMLNVFPFPFAWFFLVIFSAGFVCSLCYFCLFLPFDYIELRICGGEQPKRRTTRIKYSSSRNAHLNQNYKDIVIAINISKPIPVTSTLP